MKKHFALILSFVNLIICFICFWYSDVLINRFFIFGIIPKGICILLLLASLIISIVLIIRCRLVIKNYIALAITIATILLLFVFPFRMAKVNLELSLYEEDRLQIIQMIKKGELVGDKIGNVELPEGFSHLSSDGNVFIYQNDNEHVISFWVFRGMLSGSVELIYSSQNEALIYKNETGHPITSVLELKEHWYLVETDY